MKKPEENPQIHSGSGDPGPPGEKTRVVKRKKRRRKKVSRFRIKWADVAEGLKLQLDIAMLILIVAMILLSPLPLGSVSPWARSILFVCAAILLVLWVGRESLQGRLEIVRTPAWVFLSVFFLILCFQLIPLPNGILSVFSVQTAELYERLIPGYPDQTGPMPLSLNPHGTLQEIYRVATFAIVFFVLMNQFRHRRQITVILFAFAVLGLFQSFYGLAEKFSGSPHIFGIPLRDKVGVHGTYFNRNHFAGLIEMLTPAILGWLLALMGSRRQSWRGKQLPLYKRLIQGMSKGKGYAYLILILIIVAMFVTGLLSLSRGGALGLMVGFFVLFIFAGAKNREVANQLPACLA